MSRLSRVAAAISLRTSDPLTEGAHDPVTELRHYYASVASSNVTLSWQVGIWHHSLSSTAGSRFLFRKVHSGGDTGPCCCVGVPGHLLVPCVVPVSCRYTHCIATQKWVDRQLWLRQWHPHCTLFRVYKLLPHAHLCRMPWRVSPGPQLSH
eukprot:GHUV01019171.1.p1 GENE.GHUV01019171.1~~GHUV01019171.1.p1  ORF type:complete len:151 (+),score=19.69 GHUV01019171.1:497-949(+)